MKSRTIHLNQSGFDHVVLPLACFVVFALIGSYYLYNSLAATPTQWKGILELSSQSSGNCLTAAGSSTGSAIELEPCSKTYDANQVWSLQDTKLATVSGESNVQAFELESAAGSTECLANGTASTKAVYPITLNPCGTTTSDSTWGWSIKFTAKSYTTHQLMNLVAPSLCLDDRSASTKAGTDIGLYGCKTTAQSPANQEWYEAGAPSMAGSTAVACTTSNATGAGMPSYVVTVGSPASGDSTSEINDAIASASSHSGGGIVKLQAGTYIVDGHVKLKSNVVLEGAGMLSTVIEAGPQFMSTTDDGGYPVISTDGASNVTIENVEADQDAAGLFTAGKVNENTSGRLSAYVVDVVNSTNVIVQHVAIRNQFTYSLVANASNKFCFRYDNVLQNPAVNGDFDQLDGIHILNSTNGDVLDNYVDQRYDGATDGDDGLVAHTFDGSTEHNITYAGNVVRGGSNGNDMQIAPGGEIYDIIIKNNELYGGPFGIRTGIYSAGTNNIADITITGNTIHNNVPGNAYNDGGEAIDIGGSEAGGGLKSATDVIVENNKECEATDNGVDGAFYLISGAGNILSNNTTYTGCTDAPGNNPAPD